MKGKIGKYIWLISIALSFFVMSISATSATNGLTASYYNDDDGYWGSWDYAGTPDVVRIDPKVDFDWHSFGRNDSLPPGIVDDGYWSADWKGFIEISDDGIHSFTLNSDDGSRLYIDEELVVDNGGPHAPWSVNGSKNLTRGYHSITIKYFECCEGAANIQLYWQPPGASSDTIVPTYVLFLGAPTPPVPELPTFVLVTSGIAIIVAVRRRI